MARPDEAGENPGSRYIRVALVQEPAATAASLDRLVAALGVADRAGAMRPRAAVGQ
jgi:hypothetical protein